VDDKKGEFVKSRHSRAGKNSGNLKGIEKLDPRFQGNAGKAKEKTSYQTTRKRFTKPRGRG
jgi:hypothetical protein